MLNRVSSLKEEAYQLEKEVQCIEMAGLGKIEAAVAVSEAEGLYRLLRGAILHPSIFSAPPHPKKACHSPSATISHLPPRSLQVLYPKPLILQQKMWIKHWKLSLQLLLQLQRKLSPPTCNPFAFSWGHQKSIQVPG